MAHIMKVALLIDNLGAGGAQRQLVGLACLLKERGVDVCVYTYFPIMFYAELLNRQGVAYEVIDGADSPWKRFTILRKKLLAVSPDVLVAFLDTPCILACLIRYFGGKFKLIVGERSSTQALTRRERLKFWLYRKADYIVPNSYAQGDFISSHYPKYRDKVVVIPNFVDLDKFAYHGKRQRNEKSVIMVAASMLPLKNTKGLIETVRLLKKHRDDFVVKWFGFNLKTRIVKQRPYMAECQQLIKDYGLDDTILFYPKTKTIEEEYRKADYFCLPSFYEGTPNVLCEALACSMPVICSRICDNPKYAHEGENGFLFDPHDINDMAAKFDAALNLTDEQYAEYSINSRSIAEKNMSESMFVERYLSLF